MQGEKQVITTLRVSSIVPNRTQPRKTFKDETIAELAESIGKYGLIEPIVVKKSGAYYVIIAGERRWRASREAGLKEVPVVIRDVSEKEADEISLVENMHREDLNPIEEALAFQQYLDKYNITQSELAEILVKSRVYISNTMRLLNLPEEIRQMLSSGKISAGHGKAILSLPTKEKQLELANAIVENQLSVREAEKFAKKISRKPKEKRVISEDANLIYAANQLTEAIGSKVVIQKEKNSGRLIIEFYSNDELNRLYEHLMEIPR